MWLVKDDSSTRRPGTAGETYMDENQEMMLVFSASTWAAASADPGIRSESEVDISTGIR